jgi:hypothetical protein
MDMAENASRRGAADLSMPLMVLAFLVMGGFLYWLSIQAAEQKALAVVEDTTAAPTTIEGATVVDVADIMMDASPYDGQMITLEGLKIASKLGTQGFWLEMPSGPFLVSMSEAVKAEGLVLPRGAATSVTGVVHAISDSVLTAWTDAGTIGEGDRLAAEFATHFMEAQQVLVAEGAPGGEGSEGGAGGE